MIYKKLKLSKAEKELRRRNRLRNGNEATTNSIYKKHTQINTNAYGKIIQK